MLTDQQALAIVITIEERGKAHGLQHKNEKENAVTNWKRSEILLKALYVKIYGNKFEILYEMENL